MTSENLQRTSYRDPNLPSDPVRSGTPTLSENERDMDQYYRPLERIHGSSLHGWGVASGLWVTATLNSASPILTIQPGVALDSSGQHISLALPGNLAVQSYAEVGLNPTGLSTGATLVPVTTSGVVMPTTNLTGDKYLTIQFWETFDSNSYNNQGLFIYWHTPWLQLVDVTGFTNDGKRVVLAKVSFGTGATAGQVTALTQDLRQATDLPVGSMHLQRDVQSTAGGKATVATVEAGVLQAHATGGLDITVPNVGDEVHLARDDGGNFAKVSLGAEKIVARKGDGTTESVVIDTEAGSLTASSATVNGPISASSITASGNVTASGAITGGSILTSGDVTASGAITSRSISIVGSNNNQTISLAGDSIFVAGEITVQGTTHLGTAMIGNMDVTNEARVWGSASIGGDLTFNGNLIGAYGDATRPYWAWLYALNGTATIDVNLPVQQQVFAMIALPGIRLGGAQPFSALAYIDSVDGQPLGSPQDPAHAAWSGNAQTIRFGLTTSSTEAWALAIVFAK